MLHPETKKQGMTNAYRRSQGKKHKQTGRNLLRGQWDVPSCKIHYIRATLYSFQGSGAHIDSHVHGCTEPSYLQLRELSHVERAISC
jgi:hypothetical protein